MKKIKNLRRMLPMGHSKSRPYTYAFVLSDLDFLLEFSNLVRIPLLNLRVTKKPVQKSM